MSKITDRLDELDDGTRTLSELAEILDCSTSYICHLRREWLTRYKNGIGTERCIRCTSLEMEKIPFVDGKYVKHNGSYVLSRNGTEGAGKLCLWCWLDVKGIDHREFYESGTWMEYVDWRPGQTMSVDRMVEALREQVWKAMDERDDTVNEAARKVDCHPSSWRSFLESYSDVTIGAVTAEAAARYLGIEPNAKGLGEKFGLHPREVAIFVRGW